MHRGGDLPHAADQEDGVWSDSDDEVKAKDPRNHRRGILGLGLVFVMMFIFTTTQRYLQHDQVADKLGHIDHVSFATSSKGISSVVIDIAHHATNKDELENQFEQTLVRLKHKGACKAALPPGITIATQGSPARVVRVLQTCEKWGGDMVAVVYATSLDEIDELITFHAVASGMATEGDSGEFLQAMLRQCPRLEIVLATPSSEPINNAEYPINVLRNLAIDRVSTSHFLYLDMDLVPSSNMLDTLNTFLLQDHVKLANDNMAYVLPVFWIASSCEKSPYCKSRFGSGPDTIQDLALCVGEGYCEPLLWSLDPLAHSSTINSKVFSIPRWNPHATAYQLPCFHSTQYEPFVIVPTCSVPHFVLGFDGHGKNKIQWIEHLSWLGFRYSVLTHMFAVHLPHDLSESVLKFSSTKQVGDMHKHFLQWLSDKYSTTTTTATTTTTTTTTSSSVANIRMGTGSGLCASDDVAARVMAIDDMQDVNKEAILYISRAAAGQATTNNNNNAIFELSNKFQLAFPGHECTESPTFASSGGELSLEECKTACVANENNNECKFIAFDHARLVCEFHAVCTAAVVQMTSRKIFQKIVRQ